jgi:uncharacterized protein (TIGR00290 family)
MRAWLAWSSGKDSAFALHTLRATGGVEVVALLTTVNDTHDRVAMHAVRRDLLRAQAQAVGLPLIEVGIPHPCPNEAYEAAMAKALVRARSEGVEGVAFGDLFLADIRRYREERLLGTGLSPLFPLWGRPTRELALEMIAVGQKATLTCVDPGQLAASFCGSDFDEVLLASLPSGVDPCGENGEFHTFAWDGPAFQHPLKVLRGETVLRENFVFTDLLLNPEEPAETRS